MWDAIAAFMINPKKGNAMLDKIHEEQQHNDSEKKFHCEFRDCEVTYRKTCKKCIVASVDEDGNFYYPIFLPT